MFSSKDLSSYPKAIVIPKCREKSGNISNFAVMDNLMNDILADSYFKSTETDHYILYLNNIGRNYENNNITNATDSRTLIKGGLF